MPVSDNKYIITGWVFQYEKHGNKVSNTSVIENNNNKMYINEDEELEDDISMSNSR